MATGLAIMGFGGGEMIAKFMIDPLIRTVHRLPEYLGTVDSVHLYTKAGRRMAEWQGIIVGSSDRQCR